MPATAGKTKAVTPPKDGAKPNALQQPLQPSADLAAIVGSNDKIARGEAVSKVWDYIKKNNLQDAKDRRQINADDKMKKIFDGKASVTMFEMNKYLAKHLSK